MFDDLKQDSNDQKGPTKDKKKETESVGEVVTEDTKPAAAPVSDMFGDVDPVAEKESALKSGKMQAVSNTDDPATLTMPNGLQIDQVVLKNNDGAKTKKMIAMLISILLLAALATFAYIYFVGNSDNIADPTTTQDEVVDEEEATADEVAEEEATVDEVVEEEVIDEAALDFDNDGLSNGKEDELGTDKLIPDTDNDGVFDWDEVELYESDPLEPDTDGDELGDYDEIFIWGTDPNQVDTDNDGYGDGVEANNGYNPFGDGDIEDFIPPGQRGIE